jgi:transcriptional regulator with XRE-family HTH domain
MMASSITWLIKMSLPARLIALRKQKGLSQQAMAEAIGLHVTQIKRHESGASQPPSLDAIKKIAVALSVRRLQQIEKLDPGEKRQVLQLIDAFIERGQLKRKAG